MRILKRPMFKKGGSANEGIMNGLVDRKGYAHGSPYEHYQKFESLGEPIDLREKFEDYYTVPEGTYRDISAGQFGFPVAGQSEWDRADWYAQASAGDIEKEFGAWKTGAGEKLVEQEEEAETIRKEYQASQQHPYPGANIYAPTIKKDDRKDREKKVVDKKTILSNRAKEFYKLMSPHATKRMIADVAGAASETFAASTGDTRQDIVNAITAAAKASGGQRATYEDAMKLAIGESIQKGIATATYKPNIFESSVAFYKSLGWSDKKIGDTMTAKNKLLITDFLGKSGEKAAYKNWAMSDQGENPDFAGFLPEDKKGEIVEDVKDQIDTEKFYWDQDNRIYVKIVVEDGEKKLKKYLPK